MDTFGGARHHRSMPVRPSSYPVGVRLPFTQTPDAARAWVADQLGGPVDAVRDVSGGLSPGAAAVVRSGDRSLFIKAVGSRVNPHSIDLYRRERTRGERLPALDGVLRPAGGVDLTIDGEDWAMISFPAIDGEPPRHPWRADEATRVLDRLAVLGDQLTPSPWPDDHEALADVQSFFSAWSTLPEDDPCRADPWLRGRLDEFVERERALGDSLTGNTLSHSDLRADNILLTPDQVWFVDWAHPLNAARWLDPLILACDLITSGADRPDGGELDVPRLLREHPTFASADADTKIGLPLVLAGAMLVNSRRPSPPGLPTIRSWQGLLAERLLRYLRRQW